MLNTVYRLVEPKRIEAEFCDLDVAGDDVLVRPSYLAISSADQRYFQGARPAEILRKKLPMALIHEGIGEVLYDPHREYLPGTRVIMIPNTPVEEDDLLVENYLMSSSFRGSDVDGFMQDIVEIRRDRILILPDWIDRRVAAFTELVSRSYHTINVFSSKADSKRDVIGVWGDGNVAFITSLLLKKRLPESKVIIFGKHEYKMREFVFADDYYHIDDIADDLMVDHAFECGEGAATGTFINQIIDHIRPQGCLAAMGVSEEKVPVNTRGILEKGLTFFGSARSGAEDFRDVLALYSEKPEIVEYLTRIVGAVKEVRSIDDMTAAFDLDTQRRGKTIMIWKK